ncbi:MAG: DUF551 domain-containing protein [Candidatus Brocadiales bacterium]|nr:DUF551 domain-containing protein [Candidatus Bathyanammoxibius sp.]
MTEWISVEERLPKKYKNVLIFVDFRLRGGSWHMNTASYIEEWVHGNDPTPGVTHWMPLPEPPKEKP